MTFSICVRERFGPGDEQYRFGVAVTTRLPAVGALCPFASEHGAVATQSRVNVALGRRGVEYLDDGLGVEDALSALLNADDGRPERQVHGVDREDAFAFTGEECQPYCGHETGEHYTVAGNLLAGPSVIEATADAYEEADDADPLPERLIDALAAGHAEGGDKRTDLDVQSAALVVETTDDDPVPGGNLRVDATETPVVDLRATYERAVEGFEAAVEYHEE